MTLGTSRSSSPPAAALGKAGLNPLSLYEKLGDSEEEDGNDESFGAVYFAYSRDMDKATGYVERVRASARGLKKYNPEVPVTIFTNDLNVSAEFPFDNVVQIPHDAVLSGRQWYTRTLFLNQSPYKRTLQVDSDRTICGNLTEMFQLLRSWDLIQVSGGILPGFDNGVLGYRKSELFDDLVYRWLRQQERYGVRRDDQPPLARARRMVKGLRAGVIPHNWHWKLIPLSGHEWRNANLSRTLVMHGEVKIAAGCHLDQRTQDYFCNWLNKHQDRPRIFVDDHTSLKPTQAVLFSERECNDYLHEPCHHPEMLWEPPLPVIPMEHYVKAFMPNVAPPSRRQLLS